VRVATFNIRYANPHDGPNLWTARRPGVGRLLRELDCDLLALQEVLPQQRADLTQELPEYVGVGDGRDGPGRGEHCLIWCHRRWPLLASGTFWLSETPQLPSVGWDACLPRICTWARVHVEGRALTLYNVHLDHEGRQSRRRGLELVLGGLQEPAILAGDFNDAGLPVAGLLEARPEGPDLTTYHGFQGGPGPRIDYVYASPELRLASCRILNQPVEGRWPSDHHPVLAEFAWA
jgi:endonuclease/exonuclease/phosphatase family metal-dependent hydrolase